MAVNDRLVEVELDNGQRRFVSVANTVTCGTLPTLTQINATIGSALTTKPAESGATWLAQNCTITTPGSFTYSIEAEAVTSGTGTSYSDTGASGGQIRGNYANASEFLEITFTVPATAVYTLKLYYQTNFETGIATGTLAIAGATADFVLPALGGGKGVKDMVVGLQAGSNTIRLQGKNTGDSHSFLMDKLVVTKQN